MANYFAPQGLNVGGYSSTLPTSAPPLTGFQKIAMGLQGISSLENKPLEHLSKLAGAAPQLYGGAYANALGAQANPNGDLDRQLKEAQLFALTNPQLDPLKQLEYQTRIQEAQRSAGRDAVFSGQPPQDFTMPPVGINGSAPPIQMPTNYPQDMSGLPQLSYADLEAPLPPMSANQMPQAPIGSPQDVQNAPAIDMPIMGMPPTQAPALNTPIVSNPVPFLPNPAIEKYREVVNSPYGTAEDAQKLAELEGSENIRKQTYLADQQKFDQTVTAKIAEQQKLVYEQDKDKREGEKSLRTEFEGLPDVKQFRDVEAAYGRIQQAADKPSAAGDIALLTNYMKMLDPGSTVREGEFATAQNAASVPQAIQAQYNKILTGERLTPEQRADFLNQAGGQYEASSLLFGERANRYKELAKNAGFSPDNIVQGQRAKKAPEIEETKTVNGVTYKKVNGEWYQ